MRAVAVPGRWVWGLSGLVTAAVLLVPGARLLTAAGASWHGQTPPDTMVRALTVYQTVTSLDVQSNGGSVRVATGPVRHVQVTEALSYDRQDGGPPGVVQSVSRGRLTLADPACATANCTVSFAVIVPSGVSVTVATGGGPAAVAGAAGADLDSGGGPMSVAHIDGPLTASTEGGSLQLSVTAGANVDSGGGPVTAAQIDGPLTARTDGGPQSVGIATDPAARRSITVTSGGGSLQIGPAPGHPSTHPGS